MATLEIRLKSGETKTVSAAVSGEDNLDSLHKSILKLKQESNEQLTCLVNEEKAANGQNDANTASDPGKLASEWS